ncbi:hypothetical protein [Hymenobacter wooponensis]|uniref:Uncharacterized protein n=1 Tax=Hymenobacter wooponensis TaxID=1525360 RepID=A0A4Z0MIL8_9BACT|nr:hypothetical protein [Hymenobacter wooponensis]TGD79361.1 hypothetical protein EU557_14085 [Hymenobacter wooponensis]
MHAPTTVPLLRRLLRRGAYLLFQLALISCYVLRSVGALRLPFHFSHASEEGGPAKPGRRIRPRSSFTTRPAL